MDIFLAANYDIQADRCRGSIGDFKCEKSCLNTSYGDKTHKKGSLGCTGFGLNFDDQLVLTPCRLMLPSKTIPLYSLVIV